VTPRLRCLIQVGGTALLCATLLLSCSSKISRENFDKVRIGMAEEEVTALLGSPTESSSITVGSVGGTTATWKTGGVSITIQFVNGKVVAKAFSGKGS
jgi:hypothetical protein